MLYLIYEIEYKEGEQMKTSKLIIKKIFSIYLVLILVLSVIINIVIGLTEVQAVSHTQYKKTGIDDEIQI